MSSTPTTAGRPGRAGRRRLAPLLLGGGLLVALGLGYVAWNEVGRLRERQRLLDAARDVVSDDLLAARAEIERLTAAAAAAAERSTAREVTLESQLTAALRQVDGVNATLAERATEVEQLRQTRRAADAERGSGVIPPGLRLLLADLHEQLRKDGHLYLRVLGARAVEDGELRDVELLEASADGLGATFYRAGRIAVQLDRGEGVLTLVLRDGVVRRSGDQPEELPADGLRLAFAAVDGPVWEQLFPGLVTALGAYPETAAELAARGPRTDPATRALWVERIDRLLDAATTVPRWRIGRCRDVGDQALLGVQLLGRGATELLQATATAASLAVEVDEDSGTVSLLLKDGVLHQGAGRLRMGETGHRILLPGITPQRAIDEMLGMVLRR